MRFAQLSPFGRWLAMPMALAFQLPAQSPLTTTYAHDNQGNVGGAVYFDLAVRCYLTITGIATNTNGTSGTLDVYTASTTYVGKETTPSLWSLVGSGTLTVPGGAGAPSTITLTGPITLTPGNYGVKLVANGFAHYYTNGANTYSTAEATLTAGAAQNTPGSAPTFTPRTWNGTLTYTAQNIDAGLFLAVGIAYMVDDTSHNRLGAPVPHRQLYVKKDGLAPGQVHTWPSTRPDLRFASMFHDGETPPAPVDVDVDAMSIGQDRLWVDPDPAARPANYGKISWPTGEWMALSLTVPRNTPVTSGTIGIERINDHDGTSADVFTFVPGITNLPTAYRGTTFRSLTGADLGLDPPAALPRAGLAALDAHLPIYELDDALLTALPAAAMTPTVYFSVTSGTATGIPDSWVTGYPMAFKSGATIFSTTWSGTAWSTPAVFCTPPDLDLGPINPIYDVDALAIDMAHAPDVHILYSTAGGASLNVTAELLFVIKSGTDGLLPPTEYTDSDGTPVTTKTGASRVSDVCGSDPGFLQAGTRRHLWGTPQPPPGFGSSSPAYNPAAWISTMRSCYTTTTGATQAQIASYMSGWENHPPPGNVELAIFGLSLVAPGTWAPPTPITPLPISVHALFVRTLEIGDVQTSALRLPPDTTALFDADLWCFWICFNNHFYGSDFTVIHL